MYKNEKGEFVDLEWDTALEKASQALLSVNPKEIAVMLGDQTDLESITALRDMMFKLSVEDLKFKSVILQII
jgi:NADH dehydrogenase/NADH:ubiquinone oxidoreductase subunit G